MKRSVISLMPVFSPCCNRQHQSACSAGGAVAAVAAAKANGARKAALIDYYTSYDVMPGDSFEMRVTPPRAGSFMYHTHLNDIYQQRLGLYGPLQPGRHQRRIRADPGGAAGHRDGAHRCGHWL